ncbi:MAG: helix-turn-helix transcriptional regulator [Clostridia bacterium]|nr:helix-turn-helix transcriptional regulator [Clostridia bacterium]
MFYACLSFTGLPKVGFAHHFYTENYGTYQAPDDSTFELVYIKQGGITVELYGERFTAQPGSLLLLYRHLPARLTSTDSTAQSHCSVQFSLPCEVTIRWEGTPPPADFAGILLPMVYPPGEETERIKRELYGIVSDLGISREENERSASLRVVGLLGRLSSLYGRNLHSSASSVLSYRVKRYIAAHLGRRSITLQQLAAELDKTPNYINAVFKSVNGITIHQYINRERVRMMADLMEHRGLSFQEACENVGVEEPTYGYRLFKKQMGVSPGEYLRGTHVVK